MREYTTATADGGNPILAQRMAQHERLVQWVVRRQWLGTLRFQDALHEGRIGLWSALLHYDPGRGTAFSTYAVPAIAHAIWRAVALENRLLSSPPLDVPWTAGTAESEPIDDTLIRAALADLALQLPARLRHILIAHHGLDGHPPRTFAAIGRAMGVSRQRVHQLHVQAILWLAHPAHSLWLRRLLECNSRGDYQRTLARARQVSRRTHRWTSWHARSGEAQR